MLPFFGDFNERDLESISYILNRINEFKTKNATDRNIHSTTFNFLPMILDRLLDRGKELNVETFREAIQLSKEFAIEFEAEFTK